jgi:hypothetical protein
VLALTFELTEQVEVFDHRFYIADTEDACKCVVVSFCIMHIDDVLGNLGQAFLAFE